MILNFLADKASCICHVCVKCDLQLLTASKMDSPMRIHLASLTPSVAGDAIRFFRERPILIRLSSVTEKGIEGRLERSISRTRDHECGYMCVY